jgi:hypothetical protein
VVTAPSHTGKVVSLQVAGGAGTGNV